MPAVPSVKALYIEIGRACNLTHLRGTSEQLKIKIIDILHDLDVKILFIDEVQHLLTSQNDRILTQCRDALKGLSNHLQIPMILMGITQMEKALKSDRQLESRFPIIRLTKWDYDEEFLLLLNAFESELPLKKPSNLMEEDISIRIYEISGGVLGDIATIINESAVKAIKNGSEKITLKLINKLHESEFAPF
jgi:hypothetical protein